jgi:hypothetical protein
VIIKSLKLDRDRKALLERKNRGALEAKGQKGKITPAPMEVSS